MVMGERAARLMVVCVLGSACGPAATPQDGSIVPGADSTPGYADVGLGGPGSGPAVGPGTGPGVPMGGPMSGPGTTPIDASTPIGPGTTPSEPCPEGVVDLGPTSVVNGTSLHDLGDVYPDGSGLSGGQLVTFSTPIAFCVPDDTTSFVVMTMTADKFTTFYTPAEGDLISYSWLVPNDIGNWGTSMMHPVAPERIVSGGAYEVSFALSSNDPMPVYVSLRRGNAPGGKLHLNVVFVDSSLTEAERNSILGAFAEVRRVYATAGVTVDEDVRVGFIADRSLEVIPESTPAQAERLEMAPLSAGSQALHPLGGTIYVVREFGEDGLYGFSPGIPSIVGFERAGIAIATATHRLENGAIDYRNVSITIAHELGHYLGLRHTSERDGLVHDPLTDTPACVAGINDSNLDGEISEAECSGLGADNLMFWFGFGSNVSAHQAYVLQRTPVIR